MLNFLRKLFAPETGELKHYTIHFITTDGEEHKYTGYNYAAPVQLVSGNVKRYLISKIESDGYAKDDDDKYYPYNSITLFWVEVDSTIPNFPLKRYQVFYSDEEIRKNYSRYVVKNKR